VLDVAYLQTTLDELRVPLWSLALGFFAAALLCALADRMPPRR